MNRVRIIPNLLIDSGKLVKGTCFKNHRYVGDPINAIKIFNEKEVDELVIFDKSASIKGGPDFQLLAKLCSEAFFPLGYGGGINSIDDVKSLMRIGVEKVVFNTSAFKNISLIKDAIEYCGSQSVVVAIDYKIKFFGGASVFIQNGDYDTKTHPLEYAKFIESLGVGEIILTSVDREGTYKGYDIDLLKIVSSEVAIPVVASGGGGKIEDFTDVLSKTKVHAVTAGSLFIFYGPLKAVLINYPSHNSLQSILGKRE
jgi:cyclase